MRSHWKPIFLLGLVAHVTAPARPEPWARPEHICEVSASPDRPQGSRDEGTWRGAGGQPLHCFSVTDKRPISRPIPDTKELIPETEGAPLSSGLGSPSLTPRGRGHLHSPPLGPVIWSGGHGQVPPDAPARLHSSPTGC